MQKTKTGFKAAACLAVSALLGTTASAQSIIYDNTTGSLGQRTGEGNAEIGDAVQFAGTDRTVTQVSFEYFVTPNAGGNETAQFFLYSYPASSQFPTTLLYSSPVFNLVPATPTGFGTATISGIAVDVPDRIAWTVSFSGLDLTHPTNPEDAGLLFYTPPSVGTSPTFDPADGSGQHDFFLRHNTGGWQILDTPNLVDNLNIRFTAVPEPGTIALIVGGLATMGFMRRRKA